MFGHNTLELWSFMSSARSSSLIPAACRLNLLEYLYVSFCCWKSCFTVPPMSTPRSSTVAFQPTAGSISWCTFCCQCSACRQSAVWSEGRSMQCLTPVFVFCICNKVLFFFGSIFLTCREVQIFFSSKLAQKDHLREVGEMCATNKKS